MSEEFYKEEVEKISSERKMIEEKEKQIEVQKSFIRLLSDVMLWHENCIKSMEEEIGKHKEVIGNLESYVRELSLCDE